MSFKATLDALVMRLRAAVSGSNRSTMPNDFNALCKR